MGDDAAMSSRWIFPKKMQECIWMRKCVIRRDAIRCDASVIVFYWRHVVLASPSQVSLAKPMSKAAIPATSASEVVRRVAYRKWIHRCRVLINQISTTITAIMRHSDFFQRSICFWFTLHSIHSSLLTVDLSVLRLFKRVTEIVKLAQVSVNSLRVIIRVRLAQARNPDVTDVSRGVSWRYSFSLVAPCVILR